MLLNGFVLYRMNEEKPLFIGMNAYIISKPPYFTVSQLSTQLSTIICHRKLSLKSLCRKSRSSLFNRSTESVIIIREGPGGKFFLLLA